MTAVCEVLRNRATGRQIVTKFGSSRIKLQPQDSIALALFSKHRYLNHSLLQQFRFDVFSYENKAKRCLDRLLELGYITLHRTSSKNSSAEFVINENGYLKCRDLPEIDNNRIPYRFVTPKGDQADHDILTTYFAATLNETVNTLPEFAIVADGRYMNDQVFDQVIPDYWYLIASPHGWRLRFVEVIVNIESSRDLHNTLHKYEQWDKQPEVGEYIKNIYHRCGARDPIVDYDVQCVLYSQSGNPSDAFKERQLLQCHRALNLSQR